MIFSNCCNINFDFFVVLTWSQTYFTRLHSVLGVHRYIYIYLIDNYTASGFILFENVPFFCFVFFQSCVCHCHCGYCDSVLRDLASCCFFFFFLSHSSRAFLVVSVHLNRIQITVLLPWQSHGSRLTSWLNQFTVSPWIIWLGFMPKMILIKG